MNNVRETEQKQRAARWGQLSPLLAMLVIGVLALGPGARPEPPIALAEARGAPAQAQGSAVHLAGLSAHPARLNIGRWFFAHSLPRPLGFTTATRLGNGEVLVAGGSFLGSGSYTTTYLLNPYTLSYTPTGSMTFARQQHTATLLYSGKVLVVGGADGEVATSGVELYDPATGTFSLTGFMAYSRVNHTATLLYSGKVLVTGGCNGTAFACQATTTSAEVYDPATGTFTSTTVPMSVARQYHTATLLSSGKVLIVGGAPCGECYPWASAELYDPATGTFSPTGSLATPRALHTATLLPNGKVLIAGGCTSVNERCYPASSVISTTELYDPATGAFSPGGALSGPRGHHTATLLRTGKVLLAGGVSNQGFPLNGSGTPLATADLYDPATNTVAATGSMVVPRDSSAAALLANGWVLMVGGCSSASGFCDALQTATSEVYIP